MRLPYGSARANSPGTCTRSRSWTRSRGARGRHWTSLGITNVTIAARDGNDGWPEHAPYDGITVAAATTEVPPPLVDQLAVGGRLIIPIGEDEFQTLHLIEKRANGATDQALIDVRFVRWFEGRRDVTSQQQPN